MSKLIGVMQKTRRASLIAAVCCVMSLAFAGNTRAEETKSTKDAPADAQTLSSAQLKTEGRAMVSALEAAEKRLEQKLTAAREQKDVVKTLCLDDKHKQVETAYRTASDRDASLEEALLNGSRERAEHEYTLLGVLLERVNGLVSEADECIGEEATFTSDEKSNLSMTVDQVLPTTDSNLILLAPVIGVSPSVSSPVD